MTTTRVSIALDQFFAAQPYHPCCLLIHHDVRRLQHIAATFHASQPWPMVSIGTALSERLLPVAPAERPGAARGAITAVLEPNAPGPILCTDIDLMFEPTLRLDPLRLLRDISRRMTLVVLWPGTVDGTYLSYATNTPAHAHYRSWPRSELCAACVIPLDPLMS